MVLKTPSERITMSLTQEDMMRLASTTVNRCAICDVEDIEVLGCFMPPEDEAEQYYPVKLKPGKTRTLWYGLCSICEKLPRRAVACWVEEKMERQARAARQ